MPTLTNRSELRESLDRVTEGFSLKGFRFKRTLDAKDYCPLGSLDTDSAWNLADDIYAIFSHSSPFYGIAEEQADTITVKNLREGDLKLIEDYIVPEEISIVSFGSSAVFRNNMGRVA